MDIDYIARNRLNIIACLIISVVAVATLVSFILFKNTVGSKPLNQATASSGASINGTYVGKNKIADGLSESTVNVTDNAKIVGTAKYTGQNGIEIPINIEGKVYSDGKFDGTLRDSSAVNSGTIHAEGSFSGEVEGAKANITYSISTPETTIKNYVTLTKK